MRESAMIYYPNPQANGVSLNIQVEENGEITHSLSITGRFDQKLEFTVGEGAQVTVLNLFLKEGRCANGIFIAPILKKKGTSGPNANILPSRNDWYSSNKHYVVNADGIQYSPHKTYDSTYKITETNDGIECFSYDPVKRKRTTTGATKDTNYYFINAYGTGTKAQSLVLDPGTYIFQNKTYNSKHWDAAKGYFTGNATKWKKTGYPVLYQKMYFGDQGGFIWEKKFGDSVYLISLADRATANVRLINKDDYSMYSQNGPIVNVDAIAKATGADKYEVRSENWGRANYTTKDYFIRVMADYVNVSGKGRLYYSLWFVSKNLKDWVYTEGPAIYSQGVCTFSRLKNQGLAMGPNADFVYIVRVQSDGHVSFEEKSLPISFIQSKGNNGWNGSTNLCKRSGCYIYNPNSATDGKIFDGDHPLLKSLYGIDVDGNLYDTLIKRDYPADNIVHGWKEDCAFRTTNEVDPSGVRYQLHSIATSTDGFNTKRKTSALIMPNYTLQRIYDVPKYGMRCSFRRRDLELQKDVYDIYDTDGHALGYNVEKEYDFPFVGYNADVNNYQRHTPNGMRHFNWNPTYPSSSSDMMDYNNYGGWSFYTDGNGPLPPDIVIINSGGYTNSNLDIICPYDELGRPIQTSENRGFCFATGVSGMINYGGSLSPPPGSRFSAYYEDCKHPGRHFTTKVEWRDN